MNKKNHLILCELHHPDIHGKTDTSYKYIENHYLVFDSYDSISGISHSSMEEDLYHTDNEYDSDSESDYEDNRVNRIDDDILLLKRKYSRIHLSSHPNIRNYNKIVKKTNYIKPEIAQIIILPTQEIIAILKTFWLRIIQRKWKKIFLKKKASLYNLHNLYKKEIYDNWFKTIPSIKGMLNNL